MTKSAVYLANRICDTHGEKTSPARRWLDAMPMPHTDVPVPKDEMKSLREIMSGDPRDLQHMPGTTTIIPLDDTGWSMVRLL